MSDELLFRLFRGGDQNAFTELFKRYRREMLRSLGRLQPAVKDDIIQQTFINIAEHKEDFIDGENFHRWAYTIMHNVRKDILKAISRRAVREKNFTDLESLKYAFETDYTSYLEDKHGTPLDHLEIKHDACLAFRELEKLPAKQKAAIMAVVFKGMTLRGAATLLKVSHHTSDRWSKDGLNRLRQRLAA